MKPGHRVDGREYTIQHTHTKELTVPMDHINRTFVQMEPSCRPNEDATLSCCATLGIAPRNDDVARFQWRATGFSLAYSSTGNPRPVSLEILLSCFPPYYPKLEECTDPQNRYVPYPRLFCGVHTDDYMNILAITCVGPSVRRVES